MIPEQFALEMNKRGWLIRNEIIWAKTSSIPESMTNRFTNCFEKIYFFTKQKDYFFQLYKLPVRTATIKGIKYKTIKQDGSIQSGKIIKEGLKNMRAIWNVRVANIRGNQHISAYSIDLCKTPIQAGCPEDGIVYDPFTGSGTTQVAAIQLGRNYLGTEINPKFVEEAEKRIKKIKEYLKI